MPAASVSSSSQQFKLALNVLHEHFGPVVRDVASYVMRRGSATLAEIRRTLQTVDGKPHKLSQIKEALVVLLRHNMLSVVMPTQEDLNRVHNRALLYYALDMDAVTLRLRYPKFVLRAKQLFGEEGKAVLEAVLMHGQLPLSQLRKQVEAKLRARRQQQQQGAGGGGVEAGAKDTMGTVELQDLIHKMIIGRYLVPVVPFDLVTPSPAALTSAAAAVAARGSRAATKAAATAAAAAAAVTAINRDFAARKRVSKLDALHEQQDNDALPLEIALNAGVESAENGGKKALKRIRRKGHDEEEEEEAGGGGGGGAATNKKQKGGGEDEEAQPGNSSKAKAKTSRLEDIVDEDEDAAEQAGVAGEKAAMAALLTAGDDVLWKVGIDQFHRDLRHLACVKFVRQKVNTTAETLVRVILQHSLPLEMGMVDCERSNPLTLEALEKEVQLPANVTAKMYMDVLQHDSVRIVGLEGARQGVYCVILGNIISNLRQRTLHSIIRERYSTDASATDGDRNARICRVLLDKKFLDQQQLSELAMMSLRETRERLYHMYRDEMVTFQEVPRRADHHPNQTFYLWTFNMKQVVEEVLDRMYKGALNLRLRRQKETKDKRDLLANKDNIRDEVEAAHFDQLTMALDRLDQALENLDETLMLFTVF